MVFGIYFGVTALLIANEHLYTGIRYAGALYLIYLGVDGFRKLYKSWKNDEKSSSQLDIEYIFQDRPSIFSRYMQGALVATSNPKTIVFLSAFLPQFVSTEHSILAQFTIMYVTIVVTVFSVHSGYAAVFLMLGRRLPILAHGLLFQFVSSTIYLVLGVALGIFG